MLALTFQIGTESVALDIRRVREVIPRVRLRTTIGSPDWFPGVFVYRGRVIPVVDLHRLTGHMECPPHLSSRIVLLPVRIAPGREFLLGLLAAQVADLREVTVPEQPGIEPLATTTSVYLGPLVPDRGGQVVRLLDPDRLLPADALALVAAAAGEGT